MGEAKILIAFTNLCIFKRYGFEDLADVTLTDPMGNENGRDRTGSNRVFQLAIFYKSPKK